MAPTIADLARKYRSMLALREAHARGEGVADRVVLRALAMEFPGALREIDRLPMETLRTRAERTERAAAGHATVEPWMEMVAMFHGLYRDALRAGASERHGGRRGPVIVARVAASFGVDVEDVREAIVPGDGRT